MIGGTNTEYTRDAWPTVPGRKVHMDNNANGDPTKETYINQGVVVFAKYYTYDSNNNITDIECKED